MADAGGIEKRMTLRYILALLLKVTGMTREKLERLLGHGKLNMTDIYMWAAQVLIVEAFDWGIGSEDEASHAGVLW